MQKLSFGKTHTLALCVIAGVYAPPSNVNQATDLAAYPIQWEKIQITQY